MNDRNAQKYFEMQCENFKTVIDQCIEQRVDGLIIAGNLFGVDKPKHATIDLVIEQFIKMQTAQIPILILPGNHDTPLIITNDQPVHYIIEHVSNVIILNKKDARFEDRKINSPIIKHTFKTVNINFYANPNAFIPPNQLEIEIQPVKKELTYFVTSDLTAFGRDRDKIVNEFIEILRNNKVDLLLLGGNLPLKLQDPTFSDIQFIHCPLDLPK